MQDDANETFNETFSVDKLKQLAFSMLMKLKSTDAVPFSAHEHVISSRM